MPGHRIRRAHLHPEGQLVLRHARERLGITGARKLLAVDVTDGVEHASTFVTRLKVGEILVDAKGVSRLVSRRVGVWPFVILSLAGLGAIVTAVAASPSLRHVIELISLRVQNLLGL